MDQTIPSPQPPAVALPSPWQLIQSGLELFKKNRGVLMALAAIPGIIIILQYISKAAALPAGLAGTLYAVLGLANIVLSTTATIAIYQTIWTLTENLPQESAKQSLSKSWSKIIGYWWIALLIGLSAFGGIILFVVPGILVVIWSMFAISVYLFENKRGLEAIAKSREYFRGQAWQIFWRVAVMAIILSVPYLLIDMFTKDNSLPYVLGSALMSLAIVPIGTGALVSMYRILRATRLDTPANPKTMRALKIFSGIALFGLVVLFILASQFSGVEGGPWQSIKSGIENDLRLNN